MKITLKKDWDLSIAPPSRNSSHSGYFAGRQHEISELTNEILRRNSGAILVSGHRGVGKTSMVYQALKQALLEDDKIIIVLMNAAQLEIDEKEAKINPKKIIENLIRRLYSVSVLKDVGSNKKIEALYKKAISKEIEYKELIQSFDSEEKEIEREQAIQFKVNEINNRTFVMLVSWTLAIIYQFGGLQVFGGSFFDKFLPLLLAFPIPYIINWSFSRNVKSRQAKKVSLEVAEIYKIDNAVGNLEFDLENIHSELANKNRKLIYVIDELDKLTEEQVKGVLKYFKNLFTLSEAIFIFVGGEELFGLGETNNLEKRLGNREKEYTYFTSRYYLSRAMWSDLSEYINEIILESDLSEEDLEMFKRAICFDAGNDFFDIRSQIRDRISYFDNKHPVIEYSSLPSDLSKSGLHKAISLLYEDKYMYLNPLKWSENESLLRALFGKAYEIQRSFLGYKLDDPRGQDLNKQLIRDFYKLLNRLEVLRIQSDNGSENIGGIIFSIRSYTVSSMIPKNPLGKVTDPTEFERKYIEAFRRYCNFILAFSNAISQKNTGKVLSLDGFLLTPNRAFELVDGLRVNFKEIFDTQFAIYNSIIKQVHPYPYQREIVEENTQIIEQFCANILTDRSHMVLSRLLQRVLAEEKLGLTANFNSDPNIFSGVASSIKSSLIKSGVSSDVLFRPNYSRQMLFVNSGIEFLTEHKDILRELYSTHRVVYISEKENYDDLPLFFIKPFSNNNDLENALEGLIKMAASFFSIEIPETP